MAPLVPARSASGSPNTPEASLTPSPGLCATRHPTESCEPHLACLRLGGTPSGCHLLLFLLRGDFWGARVFSAGQQLNKSLEDP